MHISVKCVVKTQIFGVLCSFRINEKCLQLISSFFFTGYLLLAGRCRNAQEVLVVQEVIEKNTKRTINVDCLFGQTSTTNLSSFSKKILNELIKNCPQEFGHVVFTYNMRRLAVLVARALQFNEPVLLVGETG